MTRSALTLYIILYSIASAIVGAGMMSVYMTWQDNRPEIPQAQDRLMELMEREVVIREGNYTLVPINKSCWQYREVK